MNETMKALQPEARGQAFAFGLNPYGLTYHLGLQGAGGPRANPKGAGLEGFIAIATELGASVLEIYDPWLRAMSDDELRALRDRLASLGMTPDRQLRADDGSVRERAAFGPHSRRQGHPSWADDGFVRRSSRAWRQVEGACRSRFAPRLPIEVRARPTKAEFWRSRITRTSAATNLPSFARRPAASAFVSTPATPSRSQRRRSISSAASRRMCGTCI